MYRLMTAVLLIIAPCGAGVAVTAVFSCSVVMVVATMTVMSASVSKTVTRLSFVVCVRSWWFVCFVSIYRIVVVVWGTGMVSDE